jgi:hypothetical protein
VEDAKNEILISVVQTASGVFVNQRNSLMNSFISTK